MSVTSSAIQDPISKIVSYKGLTGCHRRSGIDELDLGCLILDPGSDIQYRSFVSPCPVRLWDFVLPSVIVQGCHRVCQSCEGAGAPILVPLAPLGEG